MTSVIIFIYLAVFIGSIRASVKTRIIGGEDADIKEFSYLASIRLNNRHSCGACIITKKHILTAAHCIIQKGIVAPFTDASVNTGTSSSIETGKPHRIAQATVHPEYSNTIKKSFAHDIAVITLIDKISFDETQQPIGLASRNFATAAEGIFAGWGHTSLTVKQQSIQLKKLKMLVFNHDDCKPQAPNYKILPSQLCAYNRRGYGPCFGDSGGPLVVNNEIVGIASWVYDGMCATGKPDVYTNVFVYRNFIHSLIHS